MTEARPWVRSAYRLALVAGLWTGAASAETVRWTATSLLHPIAFGEAGQALAERVNVLSDGAFEIDLRDRMVLDQDVFEALQSGVIDAAWGSAGHHHREDPALTLFSGFPFGPDGPAFTAWMLEGGGQAAIDAIYARHGLRSLYCGVLPAETGGWFNEQFDDVEDLEGLPMRAFGYGGRTLRRLGVTTFELGAGDIAPAFADGTIAAAEFSIPQIDVAIGLPEAARHLYLPGWQAPSTPLELLMTQETYAGLAPQARAILDTACEAGIAETYPRVSAAQSETLAALEAEGVEIHDWPEPVLAELQDAWADEIAEEVRSDPLLGAAWESWLAFRDGPLALERRAETLH